MRILKIVVIALGVYVGIVVAFESLIGFFQPASETTIVITTTGSDGKASDRVVSRLQSGGQMYVAANHWPRAWYNEALANPDVQVSVDGEKKPYRAVPVKGAEHDRVQAENVTGPMFRLLTGFPPRKFVRLDPL